MNALLDPAIRHALDRIVAATPDLGPTPDPHTIRTSPTAPRRYVAIAAAVIAVCGAAGALTLATRGPSGQAPGTPGNTSASPTSVTVPAPPDSTAEVDPTLTVPDDPFMVPSPITVGPGSPTAWYRLQPDLLITWKPVDNGTQLCWRSPIEEDCVDDLGHTDVLAIPTAGGQTIVINTDSNATTATVEQQDGSLITVDLERDPQLGWGIGRYDTPTPTRG